jgi:ABC-type nickel/cobalt efflux system permease component RcnA
MSPRAMDPKASNGRTRRHIIGKHRRLRWPHPTHQRSPTGRRCPGQCASADTQNVHSQAERYLLRACIGVLTALLLASVAHAVTHGLTPELVLGLALTILLLVALLALWRVGSRRKPDDTAG